ncbi:MAG: response regulator [Nitrococcus sp.]|nr:response regulator [Nitrococcus sp.]
MNTQSPIVYVVDDDKSVRKALQRLLRAAGFRVQIFASGEAFCAHLDSLEPGCLILDIGVPGETGHDVRMRLAERRTGWPIIAISASDHDATRERALQLGAGAFFTKPVDGQALIDAIRWTLTR